MRRRTFLAIAAFAVSVSAAHGEGAPALAPALFRAAESGDAVELKRLLDAGASVFSRDESGRTALLITTHANRVEAARLLCFKTLAAKDAGLPHTKEAAMCKWWGPRLAYDTVHECLLMLGHAAISTAAGAIRRWLID